MVLRLQKRIWMMVDGGLRTKFVLAASVLSLMLCACDMTGLDSEFVAEGDNELSAMSYNVWLYPASVFFIPFNEGQAERAPEAAKFLATHPDADVDVLGLQEVFHLPLRAHLIETLTPRFPHHSKVVGEGLGASMDGGTMLFSKYPLVEQDQRVFKTTRFPFNQSAMGVLYAKIRKGNHPYHIFVTHMAGLNEAYADLRAGQRREMLDFINGKNLPKDEPVILLGDFNVDYYTTEYESLLKDLSAAHVPIDGMRSDIVRTATSSAGLRADDPRTWDSGGNRHVTDGVQQWIDYGLYRSDHLQPTSGRMRVVTEFKAKLARYGDQAVDLSDHRPVLIKYAFPAGATGQGPQPGTGPTQPSSSPRLGPGTAPAERPPLRQNPPDGDGGCSTGHGGGFWLGLLLLLGFRAPRWLRAPGLLLRPAIPHVISIAFVSLVASPAADAGTRGLAKSQASLPTVPQLKTTSVVRRELRERSSQLTDGRAVGRWLRPAKPWGHWIRMRLSRSYAAEFRSAKARANQVADLEFRAQALEVHDGIMEQADRLNLALNSSGFSVDLQNALTSGVQDLSIEIRRLSQASGVNSQLSLQQKHRLVDRIEEIRGLVAETDAELDRRLRVTDVPRMFAATGDAPVATSARQQSRDSVRAQLRQTESRLAAAQSEIRSLRTWSTWMGLYVIFDSIGDLTRSATDRPTADR